jgi:hypothetical protein
LLQGQSGYGRLRQLARFGYDVSKITEDFFSSKEKAQRAEVEGLVQADAKTIQSEYEQQKIGGFSPRN